MKYEIYVWTEQRQIKYVIWEQNIFFIRIFNQAVILWKMWKKQTNNYLIVYLRSERFNNTKMWAILFQKCLKYNLLQIIKLGIWDVVQMTLW